MNVGRGFIPRRGCGVWEKIPCGDLRRDVKSRPTDLRRHIKCRPTGLRRDIKVRHTDVRRDVKFRRTDLLYTSF